MLFLLSMLLLRVRILLCGLLNAGKLTRAYCLTTYPTKPWFLLLLLGSSACSPPADVPVTSTSQKANHPPATNASSMSSYAGKLNATKESYPFANWRAFYHDGLEQYTQENCDAARQIFDTLIADLIAAGAQAPEAQKVALFQKAIEATNELPKDLIETGEREQLCELTNTITLACGLRPEQYGDGEGLASEWREW